MARGNDPGRGIRSCFGRGVVYIPFEIEALLSKVLPTYAIKAEIPDPKVPIFELPDQKTMYGGKKVAADDTVYVFASENEGGAGLVARGVVVAVTATPKRSGVGRQTPRVSVRIKRTALARRRLGREELKSNRKWNDGRPETELNFKFFRQATNKIVGLSAEAAAFLEAHF